MIVAAMTSKALGLLILARGAYWHASVRATTRITGISGQWPAVAAVIPARNESDYIARSVTSLLRQDYRDRLPSVADDDSEDGTGAAVTDAAAGWRLRVVRTTGRPPAGPENCGRSARASPRPKPPIPNICCSPTPI
jgi:cellulose synthase/poly-beta-1,6-N-acetylglucosamine synthase-like glycosyltransferase